MSKLYTYLLEYWSLRASSTMHIIIYMHTLEYPYVLEVVVCIGHVLLRRVVEWYHP